MLALGIISVMIAVRPDNFIFVYESCILPVNAVSLEQLDGQRIGLIIKLPV